MATPDPVVSAINRLEERLERLETEIADVKASIERLEAQLAREGADRQDLRGQIVEFRRRLGELEGRVQDRRGLRPDERAEAFPSKRALASSGTGRAAQIASLTAMSLSLRAHICDAHPLAPLLFDPAGGPCYHLSVSLRAGCTHGKTMSGVRESGHIFVPAGLFGGIAFLIATDLASDFHAGHGPLHLWLEVIAGGLAVVGVGLFARHAWTVHKAAEDFERDFRVQEREAQQWREEARNALEGLGVAIDREFAKWSLTEAERDVALLLLKGLSHKEIAAARHTSEGTVRQQSLAIYRKAGLTSRSSLAAFFLEGLSLPPRAR